MRRTSLNKCVTSWLLERSRKSAPKAGHVERSPADHVIILDGTMSSLEKGCETNAGLTYKLLREMRGDISLYYEPGLQWSEWREVSNVVVGRGINRQIRRAYHHLASHYRPGDRIFLFGFSRGAYAVRSLAGVIDRIGLLYTKYVNKHCIRDVYRHYEAIEPTRASLDFKKTYCHNKVDIEMIGVWDTVKALGLNLPILRRFSAAKHAFHNHALGPSVKNGYHALAHDETRSIYAPVMWSSDGDWQGHMEQMWFRGAHGDVGGELSGQQSTRPLSNIPLVWILEKAQMHGLPMPKQWHDRFPQDSKARARGTWHSYGRFCLRRKRRVIGCDASEQLHSSLLEENTAQKSLMSNLATRRQTVL